MKKLSLLLFLYLQILCLQATDISVSIVNFSFGTIANTLHVGDVIIWTNNSTSNHTVTSNIVPTGAATFDQAVLPGNTFSYTITEEGSYTYYCNFHSSMTGSFTATGTTPVVKPTLTLNALYPNPAVDNVHIESAQSIKTIDVYSEAGVLLETHSFSSNNVDLAVSKLEKGIYFLRIESIDGLVETRRIVKV